MEQSDYSGVDPRITDGRHGPADGQATNGIGDRYPDGEAHRGEAEGLKDASDAPSRTPLVLSARPAVAPYPETTIRSAWRPALRF